MSCVALVGSLALAVAACGDEGGGEAAETSATTEETVESSTPEATLESPTPEATFESDTVAIETLLVEFGASVGGEACEFYSVGFLAELGGVRACQRQSADEGAVEYTVSDVSVDGDTGNVTVSSPDGDPIVYPVVREGEPYDAYDGWLISGYFEETTAPEETAPPDEPGPIEQLVVDFGAATFRTECDFYSTNFLEVFNGYESCRTFQRYNVDDPVDYTFEDVVLDDATYKDDSLTNDLAFATVSLPDGTRLRIRVVHEFVRERGPYDGWRVDGPPSKVR